MANIRKVDSKEDQNEENFQQIPPVLIENHGRII